MEERIKELLKESSLELAEMLALKEIELKTERESRREEHNKQQEVIRKWQWLWHSAFEIQLDLEKRIKELEALVKEAWNDSMIECMKVQEQGWNYKPTRLNEWLKSKGIHNE
jgi:hypothetical protein